MKIKKPIVLIVLCIPLLVCLIWMFWHIRIYLPGNVTAEVVFADTEGTYGHDDLKYYTENGTPVSFSYMYDRSKSGLRSGSKVIVSGEITSYKESYGGEANRSLQIVPVWIAWTMPIVTVLLIVPVMAEGIRYIRQKRVIKNVCNEKSDSACKKNTEELLKRVNCGEEPFFMAEACEMDGRIIGAPMARKQCLKLYKEYAVLYRGEWMDTAKLHDYEHIQHKKVNYIEAIYVPYENVSKVRYSVKYEAEVILFYGKAFCIESQSGKSWTDTLEINAKELGFQELRTCIYEKTGLPDSDRFVDWMAENRHKTGTGIATVEFLKENFVGSDYGEKQGKPTLYYIEGIDVTSLLTADRTITLPYGVYEISVLGYTGRVRTNAGNYRYSEGYKASNTLKVVLNKDYPKLKIKVGRAVNSGAGRHLKVQRT